MEKSLKNKTLNALSWSLIQSIVQQVVQFTIGVILARLLLPSEFGLIGMLAIFMAVAQAFLNSGFGSALIQKKNAEQIDICSIFYFNLSIGLAITIGLYFLAPLIGSFYQQPQLVPLSRLLSLVVLINSFGLIQSTLITRSINFKLLSIVTTITSVLSGIIGVLMALSGYGVWSLAVQQVSRALMQTLCLWFFNNWRPNFIFSFTALRKMFGFGSRMLFSEILNQVFNNIYYVVIGRIFTPTDLGYFTRANSLQELPTQSISNMVGRVTFPVFATIQDDSLRIKSGMKKALTTLAMINFPLMIGLSAIANSLILLLFGEKWLPCVRYFQILCFIGVLFPLHLINLNVLQALGRSDLFFRLEVAKKIITVIAIVTTYRFGISWMIIGMFITSLISYYLNSYYNEKLISYGIYEQIKDLAPYLLNAICMGFIVFYVHLLSIKNDIFVLIVQAVTGMIFYFGFCLVFKLPAFMDILDLVRSQIKASGNKIKRSV